jgi:hypothetical protein
VRIEVTVARVQLARSSVAMVRGTHTRLGPATGDGMSLVHALGAARRNDGAL